MHRLTFVPPSVFLCKSSIRRGNFLYYHSDHLGGTNVTTDFEGTQKELVEYEPFGKIEVHEKPVDDIDSAMFYFTGKRLDDETGLMFYGARYYDPQLGRFITPDIFVQEPDNPQSFNRYSYVVNNPTSAIDPSGYFFGFIFRAIVRAIVGAVVQGVKAVISGKSFASGAVQGATSAAFSNGPAANTGISTGVFNCFVECTSGNHGLLILGAVDEADEGLGDLGEIVVSKSDYPSTGGSVMSGASIGRVFGKVADAAAKAMAGVIKFGIDNFHSVFDLAGLIPHVGNVFDLVNAGIYKAEGNNIGAAGALLSAAPVVGIGATAGRIGGKPGTEIVQRWMSRAELNTTRRTGFIRGGRPGTHYVTDSANTNAKRARMRSALKTTPEVRVELEVPKGAFSSPTRVHPDYGMPGGGMERTGTGLIPAKIRKVFE